MLENQANSPVANLRRITCPRSSHNSSSFSQDGASGKPGAVQPFDLGQCTTAPAGRFDPFMARADQDAANAAIVGQRSRAVVGRCWHCAPSIPPVGGAFSVPCAERLSTAHTSGTRETAVAPRDGRRGSSMCGFADWSGRSRGCFGRADHPVVQGSTTSIPAPSKSRSFLVTRTAPRARDMAAIWQSASPIGRPARRRPEAISA